MVDAFSKKIWTQLMNTDTTTLKTLAILFGWFCSESGTPTTLVSDNGPQFTAGIFGDKLKLWGVKHVFSPPYHPCSNGAAERGVQLYKDRLKKMNVSAKPVDLYVALAYIGKVHGLTPHSSTDRCPFELIKQSNLPSLFPNLVSDISKTQELTVTRHCTGKLKKRKSFEEGESVIIYDNHRKLSYPAVVSEILGTNNYLVLSDNGSKHVSGDVMSGVGRTVTGDPTDNVARDINDAVSNEDIISIVSDDDVASISSVLSDESDDGYFVAENGNIENPNIVNQNRRGYREIMNLGQAPQLPRLRSGRL